MDEATLAIANALLGASAQRNYGYAPYDPDVNTARDIGLGGPSTEYTATDYDPAGQAMNYPQIWWDRQGNPTLMPQEQAMDMALSYEDTSGLRFPRYSSIGSADVAAENRSAMGGADMGPLATLFGIHR